MVQTATAIFDRLGLDYVAAGGPTYCCGIQHHRRGQEASGERYANHTIELLQKMAPREVVMWCPSCIQFYDEVLEAELPFPKRHTAEFLADRLDRGEFTFTQPVEATVALHYHRASEPRQREGLAARRLLAAIPGRQGRGVRARPALGPDVHAGAERAARARGVAADGARRRRSGAGRRGHPHGRHLPRVSPRSLPLRDRAPDRVRALPDALRARARHRVRGHLQEVHAVGRPGADPRGHDPCMAANGVSADAARGLIIKTFSTKA